MTGIEPQQWRDFAELRPEHVQMLEYLEAEWLRAGMPPNQLRANLLRQARDFQAYELGDLVLPDIVPPTGAGRWYPWQFEDGKWIRDFEDREWKLHGLDLQIVGIQVATSNADLLSTTRKLRISGQTDLSVEEAEAVASKVLSEAKRMTELDRQDNGE